jgi:hypothetical protein
MAFLYVVIGMIVGGTLATVFMALLFLSKNADDNACEISSNVNFDAVCEELTESQV